ncbi:ATP-dependent RNA helicase [Candidatus Marinamargulisbacteria bacterium SCGC AG-439-L15]|nr:ATP-dependent RNA helicase [Candidatus Marinamargulisbacteria bacterium SCGC AG-439-L15]
MALFKKIKSILTGKTTSPSAPTQKKQSTQTSQSSTRDSEKRPYHHKKRTPYKKSPRTQNAHNKSRQTHPSHQEKHKPEPKKPSGKRFSDFELHPKLLESLAKNKFTHATDVQEKSIPETLTGKNIFCSSETGSGKTLSFLIPMIHKFYTKEIDQALIICPTREIAIQIQKTLDMIGSEELSSALVIGGTNVHTQKEALKNYPKVLIATPGRLLDMLKTGMIWLEYTGYVVLDEADRMLDMGFEEDLTKIHKELTGKHQLILFSATLFPEIKKMAAKYASEYKEIVIGNPTSVANSVEHVLVEISEQEKLNALIYLIKGHRGKMMVFFNTIRDTIKVTDLLYKRRISKAKCIHSKISQSSREAIITDFRANKINTLLASDIAARGIDIPNVELVINYDIPNNSEEYIHRVGRTGRAGKSGMAISFYSYKDKKKLEAVEKLIKGKIKRKQSYKGLLPRY